MNIEVMKQALDALEFAVATSSWPERAEQMYVPSIKALRQAIGEEKTVPTLQYYSKDNSCKAYYPNAEDCICWHDEGTGHMRYSEHTAWRIRPICAGEMK